MSLPGRRTERTERVEVAVVGGGPTGAAVAARLARRGHDVVLFERAPAWRWRACGVFSSPVTLVELRDLGLSEATLGELARPVPRLWIDAPGGASFALTYGHRGAGTPSAIGFDRSRLDPCLLSLASTAGVDVRCGVSVAEVDAAAPTPRLRVRGRDGEREISARVVIGADGVRSTVARTLGVTRAVLLPPRVGLTYHVAEGDSRPAPGAGQASPPNQACEPADGHMVVLDGAYCGFAPVPGGRINVGIVLAGRQRRSELASAGARAVADRVLREARMRSLGDATAPAPLEPIAGAAPIAHRVARLAGTGWLLAGDAAGFLDPFTGEGLHRALVSARLADAAVAAYLHGRASALADYDASMRRRFAGKDVMSWLAQLFLARPALFDYAARRLVARPALAERMGLLMGDLIPSSGAVDPRFVAAVLRP